MHPAVTEARKMLGTAYHHLGRLPGVGLDCLGLVVVVARRIGKPITDGMYGQWPQPGLLLRWFREANASVFEEVPSGSSPCPGDILTFWWTRRDLLWHVGIATPIGILHVHQLVERVVETPLDRQWLKRSGPTFRFREG